MAEDFEPLTSEDQSSLFIIGLPKTVDDDALFLIFCAYGKIVEFGLKSDSQTGERRSYAAVRYDNPDSAQQAIATLDGQTIAGSKLQVRVAIPTGSGTLDKHIIVYVKNLPLNFTTDQLFDLFSEYGKISSHVLAVDGDGAQTGSGFVRFYDQTMADNAIKSLRNSTPSEGFVRPLSLEIANKSTDLSRPFRPASSTPPEPAGALVGTAGAAPVSRSRPPPSGSYGPKRGSSTSSRSTPYAADNSDPCNVYVHNFPQRWTEDDLKTYFSRYGQITSVKVLKDRLTGASRQIGFARFSAPEGAQQAIESGHGVNIEGTSIACRLASTGPRGGAGLPAQGYAAPRRTPNPLQAQYNGYQQYNPAQYGVAPPQQRQYPPAAEYPSYAAPAQYSYVQPEQQPAVKPESAYAVQAPAQKFY